MRDILACIIKDPAAYLGHEAFGELAAQVQSLQTSRATASAAGSYLLRSLDYECWGDDIEEEAHQQMRNACSLPVSVSGALMPDAHMGYGLPIGGVLATENAVIPYAVGVDIACRVMISVCDFPVKKIRGERQKLERILEENTRFGIGASFENRKNHPVMDHDWQVTPVTAGLKDRAWSQLGTSGSGNHFVEFGEVQFNESFRSVEAGNYFAVVSHSGSRGPGSKVASYYSSLAREKHPGLPKHLSHLAWLDLDQEGAEYWEAMELMGKFASANHHLIHQGIVKDLGAEVLFQVENHHNFAWKEEHLGKLVVVHRKGATPAGRGVLGVIPGSMASPAFVVRGKGNEESLLSASHGAGRVMSRTQALKTFNWKDVQRYLDEKGVTLISAGLDEVPMVYKDIHEVMASQEDLVERVARFQPKLVKMAPAGERAED